MFAIKYQIKALSPLIFPENTGDPNAVGTLEYIPGSAVRGLFANLYIKISQLKNAHENENFYNWFLSGKLKFTNAYIVSKNKDSGYVNYPLPLSIQREKGGQAIYDLLFVSEDFREQTVGIGGYCRLVDNHLYREKVKKSLNYHHERDYISGVVKKGIFFTYESIHAGQVFQGWILGDNDELKNFKNNFQNGIYYLGRSKNAQYGKIKLEFLSEAKGFVSELPNEIILNTVSPNQEIPMALISDTIIYNDNGFSVVDLSEFKKILGNNVEIKKAFIRSTDSENFISIWKLKTPSELCFKAGSTFLIKIKNENGLNKLLELQKTGIGERTHEGFGRFVIGWQMGGDKITEIKEKNKSQKPSGEAPQLIEEITKKVIIDYIINYSKLEAIKEAGNFNPIPPKSLIYRVREMIIKEERANEIIKKLKKTAISHLEKCRKSDMTLKDFVEKYNLNLNHLIKQISNMNELCKKFEIQIEEDAALANQANKIYWDTFFSALIKRAKQGGER